MYLIAGGVWENIGKALVEMIRAGRHRGNGFSLWTDVGTLSSGVSRVENVPVGRVGLLALGNLGRAQPLVGELALLHRGGIYNGRLIRAFLEGRGVSFDTDSDREVILRLLEFLKGRGLSLPQAVGEAMRWLEGDYAVAFFDGGRIYLFRDPIGMRPLYFSPNGFFASEKKVLWAIGERATPVAPGELVILDGRSVRRVKLFSLEQLRGRALPEKSVLRGLKNILSNAVRNRVAKKTGVLFSGGLDSTLVALLASSYSDVTLYTAGAEGSQDVEWAGRVADYLGLPLRVRHFDVDDIKEALPKVVFAIEEPNPMNIAIGLPLYFASQLASREGVQVLLSGQGADELFGGYAKYLERPGLMWEDLLTMSERNLARDDKVATLNGVDGRHPFLALPVVGLALRTPPELKIGGGRKVILRRLARELGLPDWIAERPKKAAQYGSNAQKLLRRIARERGLSLGELAETLFREVFRNAF